MNNWWWEIGVALIYFVMYGLVPCALIVFAWLVWPKEEKR